MGKVEKTAKGIRLIGEPKTPEEKVKDLCSQLGVEFIGSRVDKNRENQIYIKYEGELYYCNSYPVSAEQISFAKTAQTLETIEPIENYQYRLFWFNDKKEEYIDLYYKADELAEAEAKMAELGDDAAIEEI